jgi:GTP-binding protein|nr:ribosome biogenesis GTPase Der [Kofleriaceae bacterium]
MTAPLVAIVGRPNVGKSTLFNRLVGGRPALVHDTPHLTRDRRYGELDYFGSTLRVVDTGGLDLEAQRDVVGAGIHRQAMRAIDEADALVLVVDGRAGVSSVDHELANKLRATGKLVFLVVNKIDHPTRDALVHDFHELGIGDAWPVSAAHGRGVDALVEAIVGATVRPVTRGLHDPTDRDPDADDDDDLVDVLSRGRDDAVLHSVASDDETVEASPAARGHIPPGARPTETFRKPAGDDTSDGADDETLVDEGDVAAPRPTALHVAPVVDPEADAVEDDATIDDAHYEEQRAPDPSEPLRVAFVGRPNAGKSSLTNRLLGDERSLVHHEAGTTTDPVDTAFSIGGRDYVLVDTAGIRRKARVDADIERIAVSMALSQIARADVAVLVIDGALGPAEQDARIAGNIEDSGRALVVALNKSDLVTGDAARKALLEATRDTFHFLNWAATVTLSAARGDGVDRLLDVVDRVAREHARRVPTAQLNRFFAEVVEQMPPPLHHGRAVRIHYITQAATRPPTFILWANTIELAPSYRRFLANRLRERYGFKGTPIRIVIKARKDRHDKD